MFSIQEIKNMNDKAVGEGVSVESEGSDHFKVTMHKKNSIELRGSKEFVRQHMPYAVSIVTAAFESWVKSEMERRPLAEIQKDVKAMLADANRQLAKIPKGGRGSVVMTNVKKKAKK